MQSTNRSNLAPCVSIVLALLGVSAVLAIDDSAPRYAGIRIVDEATGRGVPLVELETVHHLRFVSDSAGLVAIDEPELIGQAVFFHVRSHGYEFPKDGFGIAGTKVALARGKIATLRVRRRNIAERLYRITGAGIYRDSTLLGESTPLREPLGNGSVAGQDSAFAVPYRGKLFWFWGDTNRLAYPLGHFWMAGAVSELPDAGGLDPRLGIDLRYFTDASGFSRPVCRLGVERGLIWSDAFATVTDDSGGERLVCHWAHMESLAKMLGHGLAIWNDEREEFEKIATFDLAELWRWPGQAHPLRQRDGDREYLLLGEVFPTARVPARLAAFTDLASYEAWTCLAPGSTREAPRVERDSEGKARWGWRRDAIPVDVALEARLLAAGELRPDEARYQPVDVDSGKTVRLARGSIAWNAHRERWILIAGEHGGTSFLGEIWYSEAPAPTGPWRRAKKIVTHDAYSFYNPVHHPTFDRDGGRTIFFEGTYVTTFSGNPLPTPRYDYNQILYRLDLDDPRLTAVRDEATTERASALPWIRISDDGKDFVAGDPGERFVAWGVNYDHDGPGRLLEEYWRDEWETVVEDFREIRALGANTVRIHLQVASFLDAPDRPNAASLARLAKLVRLAEENRLWLDLTGLGCYHVEPAWYAALPESERWDAQAVFWAAIARTCRASSAVFCYDLMNEPILPGGGKPETEWLAGEFAGKHFVQRIALDLAGRSREEVAERWVERLVAAIRAHDERHLITVGVIPWALVFPKAAPIFYAPAVGAKLDFASVHFYPKRGQVAEALAALAVYDVGKPLVIEEMFPLECSTDELCEFIAGSRAIADGWMSFYWGTTIAEYAAKESPTIADAITREWLTRFRDESAQVGATFEAESDPPAVERR